jgi:hypothetical protein
MTVVVLVITFCETSFPFCRDEAITLLDIWEVFGIVEVVLENVSKKVRVSSAVKNSFSDSFILNGYSSSSDTKLYESFVVVCFEFVAVVVDVVAVVVLSTVEVSVIVVAAVVVINVEKVIPETVDDLISSLFSCRIFCSIGN